MISCHKVFECVSRSTSIKASATIKTFHYEVDSFVVCAKVLIITTRWNLKLKSSIKTKPFLYPAQVDFWEEVQQRIFKENYVNRNMFNRKDKLGFLE